ncbi:type II toxin-antitoxin system PemK/MazF family toxin [Bacillus badius]|uniref:type II toxin-antitoxin system PemK/MazF family toxin n=1 Tax=Bacillus badius TaxID=1455 RepID=UPI002E1A335E|nr:type II toxin-antitoxin system PemK/MazF family toxin [Bacillus badius]MED0665687.1 type II toxin-antitoxin system PemK/MazF family toxin [Bacillus badius]
MTDKHPSRGDIYWANLEPVKGSEQGGSRPVFVISNDLMNQTASICIVIPITRPGEKVKNYPFNIKFESSDWSITPKAIEAINELGNSFAGQGGYLLCNQARAFSKERLLVKMGTFNSDIQLRKVEDAIIHSYGLDICTSCGTPHRPGGLKCFKCGKRYQKKCFGCGRTNPLNFKYCPDCGRSER